MIYLLYVVNSTQLLPEKHLEQTPQVACSSTAIAIRVLPVICVINALPDLRSTLGEFLRPGVEKGLHLSVCRVYGDGIAIVVLNACCCSFYFLLWLSYVDAFAYGESSGILQRTLPCAYPFSQRNISTTINHYYYHLYGYIKQLPFASFFPFFIIPFVARCIQLPPFPLPKFLNFKPYIF